MYCCPRPASIQEVVLVQCDEECEGSEEIAGSWLPHLPEGYQKAVVLHTAEYAAMRLCRFHGVVGGSSVIKPISPGHPAQTYK